MYWANLLHIYQPPGQKKEIIDSNETTKKKGSLFKRILLLFLLGFILGVVYNRRYTIINSIFGIINKYGVLKLSPTNPALYLVFGIILALILTIIRLLKGEKSKENAAKDNKKSTKKKNINYNKCAPKEKRNFKIARCI